MALDQGTTASRCLLISKDGRVVSSAAREYPQSYPAPGYVEQDPMDIWATQFATMGEAMQKVGVGFDKIDSIGITNQRETVIVWEKESGRPIHPAIVWQCRRTAPLSDAIRRDKRLSSDIRKKTGLLPDPYFSATKLRWILDHVEGAQSMAEAGKLCFGTVDTWLLWRLTGGRVFATDYSNASRTMLFNLHTLDWDEELLAYFNIPRCILPTPLPSSGIFGMTDRAVLGASLPIGGVAGDQQAALFGQCCFKPGMVKNTYGTGGFLLMQTGDTPCMTENGLLTTVAWGLDGKVSYALEGSVFVSGAAVGWLRDGLRLIHTSAESRSIAEKVADSGGVVVVPAFTGLGAPYWNPYARGAVLGITRATTDAHLVRATLESMAFQTADVVRLMQADSGYDLPCLRVDGGASENDLLLAFQADLLGVPIERPQNVESTALGAAFLSGLATGFYGSIAEVEGARHTGRRFMPDKGNAWRDEKMELWRRAVEAVQAFAPKNN